MITWSFFLAAGRRPENFGFLHITLPLEMQILSNKKNCIFVSWHLTLLFRKSKNQTKDWQFRIVEFYRQITFTRSITLDTWNWFCFRDWEIVVWKWMFTAKSQTCGQWISQKTSSRSSDSGAFRKLISIAVVFITKWCDKYRMYWEYELGYSV